MKRKTANGLIAVLVLLAALVGCIWSPFETEEEQGYSRGDYLFDPGSVFQALEQGDRQVFSLPASGFEATPGADGPPVQWTQSDYLRLAEAFHQFKWGETLDNWSLQDIHFRVNQCKQVPLGPQWVSLKLFKVVDEPGVGPTRYVHYVHIYPQQGLLSWAEVHYFPSLQEIPPLDWWQIKIAAEQALQIAEQQGGREARLAVDGRNSCWVHGRLISELRENDWRITYSSGDDNIFDIQVDEQSGQINFLQPPAGE